MLDPDLHLARALLIEGNPLLRSITTSQLRDAGVGQVIPCPRVRDARLLLEREKYDIVICNREFEGSDISGQDLLDELRREQLLPYSTVFLMVTSSATYAQVVEAAESALDGFLVRPYTAAALTERLLEARQRKRLLADVMKALEAGDLETAFARALKRFQEQLPYAAYCGRLAAELLLRMGRPEDSAKVFSDWWKFSPPSGPGWGWRVPNWPLGGLALRARSSTTSWPRTQRAPTHKTCWAAPWWSAPISRARCRLTAPPASRHQAAC